MRKSSAIFKLFSQLLLDAALGGGLIVLNACIVFNEDNNEPGEIIGASAVSFDLRDSVLRRRESAIGNWVADALLSIGKETCKTHPHLECPHIAFINSSAIRQNYRLGKREKLPAGKLFLSDFTQLLPFGDFVVLVKLSGADIRLALEHGISRLASQFDSTQASYFLNTAGLSFSVDCKQKPEEISSDGLQIVRPGRRVNNVMLTSNGLSEPLEMAKEYILITTSYIAKGNDGFLAFVQRNRKRKALLSNNKQFLPKYCEKDTLLTEEQKPLPLSQATIQYVRSHQYQGKPLQMPSMGRIQFDSSCYPE